MKPFLNTISFLLYFNSLLISLFFFSLQHFYITLLQLRDKRIKTLSPCLSCSCLLYIFVKLFLHLSRFLTVGTTRQREKGYKISSYEIPSYSYLSDYVCFFHCTFNFSLLLRQEGRILNCVVPPTQLYIPLLLLKHLILFSFNTSIFIILFSSPLTFYVFFSETQRVRAGREGREG